MVNSSRVNIFNILKNFDDDVVVPYYGPINISRNPDVNEMRDWMYSNVLNTKYSLDELWPYKGFVKPIRELATPHLQNIVDLFQDETKFTTSSDGKQRDYAEVYLLKRRVALCQTVLTERKAVLETSKLETLNRRILDTKIQLATFRARKNQPFNYVTSDEYEAMTSHVLSLLIDIQEYIL